MFKRLFRKVFHKKNETKVFQGKPMPVSVPPFMDTEFTQELCVSSAQVTNSIPESTSNLILHPVSRLNGLDVQPIIVSAELDSLANICVFGRDHDTYQQQTDRKSSCNGTSAGRTNDSIAGSFLRPEYVMELFQYANLSEESEIGFLESSVSVISSYLKVSSLEEEESEVMENTTTLKQKHESDTDQDIYFDAVCEVL